MGVIYSCPPPWQIHLVSLAITTFHACLMDFVDMASNPSTRDVTSSDVKSFQQGNLTLFAV